MNNIVEDSLTEYLDVTHSQNVNQKYSLQFVMLSLYLIILSYCFEVKEKKVNSGILETYAYQSNISEEEFQKKREIF